MSGDDEQAVTFLTELQPVSHDPSINRFSLISSFAVQSSYPLSLIGLVVRSETMNLAVESNVVNEQIAEPYTHQRPTNERILFGKNQLQWHPNPTHPELPNRVVVSSLRGSKWASQRDFFRHFINQLMLSKSAHHTSSRLPNNSQPVREVELLGFIGLLLMFGITNNKKETTSRLLNCGTCVPFIIQTGLQLH